MVGYGSVPARDGRADARSRSARVAPALVAVVLVATAAVLGLALPGAAKATDVGTIAWAWGGEGRPPADGSSWKMGDDFTGDPPSEAQGAHSIFDTDISTLEVLRRHATALGQL